MTTQPKARESELLPVTQADRDAAADYMKAVSLMQGHDLTRAHAAFQTDMCDDLPIVQAFARHRLATRPALPAGDVEGVARALRCFVAAASDEERQLPAVVFICNRDDEMARALLASLPRGEEAK